MTTEVIVNGFCNLVCFNFETEEESKVFESIYNHITYCYDKKKCLTQFTKSVRGAKELAEIYKEVNRNLMFPVDFIPKGKYLFIVRRESNPYDFLKNLPNTSQSAELFLACMHGGEELQEKMLRTFEAGYKPEVKITKTGTITVKVLENVSNKTQ